MPVGAASFAEGAALGRRDVPRAEGAAARPRPVDRRSATKAASRPNLPSNEEALKLLVAAIETRRATGPGDEIALALDVAATEFYDDGKYDLAGEGAQLLVGRVRRLPRRPVRPLPDRLDRGRHGRGRLGRLGRAHRTSSASACSSSATTCSSPTPSGSRTGIELGVANSILVKVNQIGTLTETLDTMALAVAQRLHVGDVAPQRRDRGRHDRRPRGRDQLRPDQDRRAGPRATGSRSTTSCCASRRSSARAPRIPGGARVRAARE